MRKRVRRLTVGEFRAQFGEESQCAEQLTRQRWPRGFRWPRCAGATRGYIASRRVHECKQCAYPSMASSKPRLRPEAASSSNGGRGYRKLNENGFEHTATVISSQDQPAHTLFPWVHISLSNLKRFLLGTRHQVQAKHLKRYVAEFNYRLNRSTLEPDLLPRLLRACLGTQAITLQQLTADA